MADESSPPAQGAASVHAAAGDGKDGLLAWQSRYGLWQPGSHNTRAKFLVCPSGPWDIKKCTL